MNFKRLFNWKVFEFGVENGAYCPHTSCGTLIYPGFSAVEKWWSQEKRIFPYSKKKKIWSCIVCEKKMCVTCNKAAHSLGLPCVGEEERAWNARFYARARAAREDRYITEVIAQNKYKDNRSRSTGRPEAERLFGSFRRLLGV
jgi:hypothetical protein